MKKVNFCGQFMKTLSSDLLQNVTQKKSPELHDESPVTKIQRLKVSVKENEVPKEKNSSRVSIFATKASYISN